MKNDLEKLLFDQLDPKDVVEGMSTLLNSLEELEDMVARLLAVDGSQGVYDAHEYIIARRKLVSRIGKGRILSANCQQE